MSFLYDIKITLLDVGTVIDDPTVTPTYVAHDASRLGVPPEGTTVNPEGLTSLGDGVDFVVIDDRSFHHLAYFNIFGANIVHIW